MTCTCRAERRRAWAVGRKARGLSTKEKCGLSCPPRSQCDVASIAALSAAAATHRTAPRARRRAAPSPGQG
eukprot:scaffold45260_cov39-Phaeocystis_antarctica.AAC.1